MSIKKTPLVHDKLTPHVRVFIKIGNATKTAGGYYGGQWGIPSHAVPISKGLTYLG